MNNVVKWGMASMLAVALTGCSSGMYDKMTKRSHPHKASTEPTLAFSQGAGGPESFDGEELVGADTQALLERQVFYFDFDSSQLKDNYVRALKAHAQYLSQNPRAKIRLEGHTDERGSGEYNVALGERRAKTVERILEASGAQPNQVIVVSYGKEKPAVQGHEEGAWKYNRRAVIAYEES